MRVLFMGSPQEAVIPLQKLIELQQKGEIELAGVVSRVGKPRGRGLKTAETPVSRFASKKGLPLYLPIDVNTPDFIHTLRKLNIDVILTVAYGQIMTQEFIALARRAVINIHPSLLPHLRGAAPLVSAILAGDEEIGVTICFTVVELDAGNIIVQKKFTRDPSADHRILTEAMFTEGTELLPLALSLLRKPDFKGTSQNPQLVTTCGKVRKEDGLISWHDPGSDIFRKHLAYYGWPEIYTHFRGTKVILKQIATTPFAAGEAKMSGGEFVLDRQHNVLRAKAADSIVTVGSLQVAGRSQTDARSFWNGIIRGNDFKFA